MLNLFAAGACSSRCNLGHGTGYKNRGIEAHLTAGNKVELELEMLSDREGKTCWITSEVRFWTCDFGHVASLMESTCSSHWLCEVRGAPWLDKGDQVPQEACSKIAQKSRRGPFPVRDPLYLLNPCPPFCASREPFLLRVGGSLSCPPRRNQWNTPRVFQQDNILLIQWGV